MITFTANKVAAVSAFQSSRIEERGAYDGTFTGAKAVTSSKGTQGVEFEFTAEDGRSARYLTLWTHDASGKEIHGTKLLSALMTVMGVESINATDATVKEYDFNQRKDVNVERSVFNQLMNIPVGVVLRVEEYEKRNGVIGRKMAFVNFFNAESRKTAAEIIRGDRARQIDEIIKVLEDKRIDRPVATPVQVGTDYGDDIPF